MRECEISDGFGIAIGGAFSRIPSLAPMNKGAAIAAMFAVMLTHERPQRWGPSGVRVLLKERFECCQTFLQPLALERFNRSPQWFGFPVRGRLTTCPNHRV